MTALTSEMIEPAWATEMVGLAQARAVAAAANRCWLTARIAGLQKAAVAALERVQERAVSTGEEPPG